MSSEEDSWSAMNSKELEHQYSPSLWCKRFKPGIAEFVHLRVISNGYKDATKFFNVEKDLSYGPLSGEKLDFFSSATPENDAMGPPGSPIVAFVHGGFWQMLNKQQGGLLVKPLVEAGCTVALIGYDLAPLASMDVMVEEVQEAAKYVLDIAMKKASSGVYFCGHSAGAHLAVMIATADWLKGDKQAQGLIKGYISISGIYDLRPLVTTSINEPLDMNNDNAKCLSPLFLLDSIAKSMSDDCHYVVAVGENDSPEFQRQSKLFQKGLEKNGVNSELVVVPEVDHFSILENINDSNFTLTKKILELVSSRTLS